MKERKEMRLADTGLGRLGGELCAAAQTFSRKKITRRVTAGVLAMSMVATTALTNVGITAWAAEGRTVKGIDSVADNPTIDGYEAFLNEEPGWVWSDKSVYTTEDQEELKSALGEEGLTDLGVIPQNADFVEVFSALGSGEQIKDTTPVDLVIVLDVSTSMGISSKSKDGKEEARIKTAVDAINTAIDMLMNQNGGRNTNRVGLVLYGTKASAFLELGHYEGNKNKDYIKLLDEDSFSGPYSSPRGFTLQLNVTGKEITLPPDKDGLEYVIWRR